MKRTAGEGVGLWAKRLAAALCADDGDAFIAAYDALLNDPARYGDEEIEAIKDRARTIYDAGGVLEDASASEPATSQAHASACATRAPAVA
ncbi:hypothetical protein KFE25_000693 [Diacronema lutheri]|uniref:Uncharacterized protein n=1 Tax=Diacronema lutheri TaxID=2081491 RepID=A0A8J6CA96_DIALT|nr:hypothetical protein KFE25_000693 [Diacronema lutheri]